MSGLRLRALDGVFAIARLDPRDTVPSWAHAGTFAAVTRTPAELSILTDASVPGDVTCERGWCGFVVEGPLPFTMTGVLASLTTPLAAAGTILPLVYARYRRGQRLAVFEEQFPEAIDLIARSLRAGHTLTTGLGIAADEVPPPVGLEFRRVFDEQNFGMSLPEALKGMARRVPVLDARFFVTAVLTQRETGGNLAELLDNLSGVMRERFKVRRQIRVVSAHGRLTAWILSLLPPILGAVLYLVSPQFMQPLFDDPLGVRMLTFAVGMQVLGTFIISRLVRVEY